MRKGQVKLKRCLNCGKYMKPVKDPIKHTYTDYLWHCPYWLEFINYIFDGKTIENYFEDL